MKRISWIRGCALALALAGLAWPASAQDLSQARITGTQSGSDSAGSWTFTFQCVGTPTCRGTHTLVDRWTNCSNTISLSGTIEITGLALASPGPIQGNLRASPADYEIDRNADGTCSMRPGSARDHDGPYTGHWDGATGTLRTDDDDPPITFRIEAAFQGLAELRKQVRHEQISATDVVLAASSTYEFRANVFGHTGSAPPRVTGPFNLAALGARHNDGNLVYDTGNDVWRWGQGGTDFFTTSRSELDSLFPNGMYSFTIPGGGVVPLTLTGDRYPAPGRLTLGGGSWVGGSYQMDPSQPLTITTSAFAEWGAGVENVICLIVRGPGFVPIERQRPRSTECSVHILRTRPGTSNVATFTIPAGTLAVGQDYLVSVVFLTVVGGSSVSSARYGTVTTARVKTAPPVFPMTVTSNITPTTATATAQIQFRPQDVGTQGSVFVFALAPQNRVVGAVAAALKVGYARQREKSNHEAPAACVLAQLNSAGQLVAVSSANLAAYSTGTLSAQGASVSILNGVPTSNVAGATFFVGYGPTSTAMINSGVNRAAVTVPGPAECRPEAPQTGWWWNPAEDGRGYSIERRGNNLFFASFLYDVSGRSTWLVASGPTSLEGALFAGDLLEVRGGQTLGGAYSGFPSDVRNLGRVMLAFDSTSAGTMSWPGGTVALQRFNIVPNGLATGPAANMPESGWWWNEQESGRGFFLEWQGNMLDIAGYMYDDAGNPVWYITVGPTSADGRTFSGTWWSYGNGMTLMGPWRQHRRVNDNVAPVTITFTSSTTATMTLPNGRTTSLVRHRF